MVGWGKRKDGQSYPKDGKRGIKSSGTSPVADVHLKEKSKEEKEEHQRRIDYKTHDFLMALTDFGSMDIDAAINAFDEVGLHGSDLAEQIRNFSDETRTPLDKIDPVYIAYDHILQMARNKIDEVLGFDIVNDIHGGTEFYTAGNYSATSYDYSQEAVDQLQEKIDEASAEERRELTEDKFVKFFTYAVDVELQKRKKSSG